MGTLVCFHAHPDDESISTGGTIARAVAEGHRVVLVVATNGDHGEVPDDLAPGETLVDRRRAETAASAAVLGVHRVEWLGYADSGMTGWEQNGHEHSFLQAPLDEAAEKLAAILREEQADVLTTLRLARQLRSSRPHQGAHRSATAPPNWPTRPVVFETTMNRDAMVRFFEHGPRGRRHWRSRRRGLGPQRPGRRRQPDRHTRGRDSRLRVDVSAYVQQKRESIRCHKSQITDAGFFSTMPDEQFAFAFGHEWFIVAGSSEPLRDGWLFE